MPRRARTRKRVVSRRPVPKPKPKPKPAPARRPVPRKPRRPAPPTPAIVSQPPTPTVTQGTQVGRWLAAAGEQGLGAGPNQLSRWLGAAGEQGLGVGPTQVSRWLGGVLPGQAALDWRQRSLQLAQQTTAGIAAGTSPWATYTSPGAYQKPRMTGHKTQILPYGPGAYLPYVIDQPPATGGYYDPGGGGIRYYGGGGGGGRGGTVSAPRYGLGLVNWRIGL